MSTTPSEDEDAGASTRVARALAEAAVGRADLFRGLHELGGIGPVRVEGGTAVVHVTLPIPSSDVRASVEREIRDAVEGPDGVDDVEAAVVRFEPRVPDLGERVDLIPDVKHVIAVGSGKGGVGKSTVATNLAVGLSAAGADVGLLDADVYGPNAPQMLGLGERSPNATLDDRMVPREAHGVRVMSMGFITDEEDPVIWRGPIVDEFVKQLFGDVEWGALDYLVVDLPPGTGDAQLSLVQHLPVTGAVVVTTPQGVAVEDARKSLEGFARYDVPVLGIAENMAGFRCPDCGTEHDLFDAGGGDRLGAEFDIPVLGRVPVDPAVGQLDGEDPQQPPGVSIPGLGRLQLPRTQAERERPASNDPMVVREGGGETRAALESLATRTAARVNAFVAEQSVREN
jgi:ATP-binding protein involved in chromosome partitioning